MSSPEWSGWIAYESLEPWDETRADWRAAMLASLYVNAHIDHKKHKPTTPSDFMPAFDKADVEPAKEKRQTVEQQRQAIELLASAFGVKAKQ